MRLPFSPIFDATRQRALICLSIRHYGAPPHAMAMPPRCDDAPRRRRARDDAQVRDASATPRVPQSAQRVIYSAASDAVAMRHYATPTRLRPSRRLIQMLMPPFSPSRDFHAMPLPPFAAAML